MTTTCVHTKDADIVPAKPPRPRRSGDANAWPPRRFIGGLITTATPRPPTTCLEASYPP